MKGKYRSKKYTNNTVYTLTHNKVARKNNVKIRTCQDKDKTGLSALTC